MSNAAVRQEVQTACQALVSVESRVRQAVLSIRSEGAPVLHVLMDRPLLERLLHGQPGESVQLSRPDGQRLELRLVLENGERWLWLLGPGRVAFPVAQLELAFERAEARRRRLKVRRGLTVAALGLLLTLALVLLR